MPSAKHIVFDIEGTLVAHDHVIEVVEEIMGDRLRAAGVQPKMLVHLWFEVAEREYTYLSVSDRYIPFIQVFKRTFRRCLRFGDVPNPETFVTDAEIQQLMDGYKDLKMRDGAVECISKLRKAGFTVWAFTCGDREQVRGYFEKAGIDMPGNNVRGCDANGVAKPVLQCYMPLLEELKKDGTTPWFAAAHMWDVSAAHKAG